MGLRGALEIWGVTPQPVLKLREMLFPTGQGTRGFPTAALTPPMLGSQAAERGKALCVLKKGRLKVKGRARDLETLHRMLSCSLQSRLITDG